MAKIYAPNRDYNGVSAGVAFARGVGETNNPHLINWFNDHGYTVECILDKNEESTPFEEMKKDELKELATSLGIDFNSKTTNEQLIELIKSKQHSGEEAGQPDGEDGEQEV